MQPLPDLSTLSLGLAARTHLVPGLNGFCRASCYRSCSSGARSSPGAVS